MGVHVIQTTLFSQVLIIGRVLYKLPRALHESMCSKNSYKTAKHLIFLPPLALCVDNEKLLSTMRPLFSFRHIQSALGVISAKQTIILYSASEWQLFSRGQKHSEGDEGPKHFPSLYMPAAVSHSPLKLQNSTIVGECQRKNEFCSCDVSWSADSNYRFKLCLEQIKWRYFKSNE